MTKDRLRSLSYDELSQIAEDGNISVLQDMDKESLISVIFEAFEEERLDREGNNNTAIQVESKKFSVSQDEELFADFGDNEELPERYQETRLVIMLRDPSWIYCYWDIEDRIISELEEKDEYSGLILRVTELAASEWGRDSTLDWFDIPVQFADLRRYINLPSEESYYGVELYALLGEKERLICRSNIVESTRDYLAPDRGGDHDRRDQLIELTGVSNDTGTFPGVEYLNLDNPQRITLKTAGTEN